MTFLKNHLVASLALTFSVALAAQAAELTPAPGSMRAPWPNTWATPSKVTASVTCSPNACKS